MNGFVIIDKEAGMTSFFAASRLKKIYSEKKTGHTGTLDPMATGVLPVALGKATRFIDYLPDNNKAYIADFKLGITTDTLDITGEVLSECEADFTDNQVESVVLSFLGESDQLPPMYSAISVNGQRLYKLARQGIEVEREKRKIFISDIRLLSCDNGIYRIYVECSKGTYIRSIISDIGDKLGCGAVMTALRRTIACGYDISQAKTLDEIRQNPEACLLPIDSAFDCYPAVSVSENQAKRFSNGGDLFVARIHGLTPQPSLYRVYCNEIFLGLGRIKVDNTESLFAERVIGHE